MIKCDLKDCPCTAAWRPVLLLFAFRDSPPAEAHIGVNVCDAHAVSDPWAFLTEEGWQQLSDRMTSQGCMAPSRELTEVGFASLDKDPMPALRHSVVH